MKFREIQGYERQPSIIHTRLFVWQDSLPDALLAEAVSSEYMDAHICGFRKLGNELFQTGIWEDVVQGTVITKLGEEHIKEAAEFYSDQKLIVVPVHCRTVRVEAQMFV